MRGFSLGLFLALALVPAAARAQAASASSHALARFTDPAMRFTAPDGFVAQPLEAHDPKSFEGPTVVAAFARDPGTSDVELITVAMENFSGLNVDGFELLQENQLREQVDGVFVQKQKAALPNGMPAYWVRVSSGDGFNQRRRWLYEWVDGVRGVTLSITARYGRLDDQKAKEALKDVSAVLYPINRY